jgi:hypothetical protein
MSHKINLALGGRGIDLDCNIWSSLVVSKIPRSDHKLNSKLMLLHCHSCT